MLKSALEKFSTEFTNLFQVLKSKLDKTNFVKFMAELGYIWPQEVTVDFSSVTSKIDQMQEAIGAINLNKPFDEQREKYSTLFSALKTVASSINDIGSIYPSTLPASLPPDFASKIGGQTSDYLLCTYLEHNHLILFTSLVFSGIIETEIVPFTQNIPSHKTYVIRWERISEIISDFIGRMRDMYGWGNPDNPIESQLLLDNIEQFMLACGIPTGQYNIDPLIAQKLYFDIGQEVDSSVWAANNVLHIPLYEIADSEIGYTEAGFSVLAIPDRSSNDKKLRGFAIAPYIEGGLDLDFALTENLRLVISGDLKTGLAVNILPSKVFIESDIYETGSVFDGSFKIELKHSSSEGKIVLLGEPGKSRFEYENLVLRLELTETGDERDLIIETGLNGASIIIQGSEGDGFINKILPTDPINLAFDLILGLSRNKGVYFKTGAALEFTIQINKSLGPIFISTIDLKIGIENKTITLVTVVSGNASIGPVSASVEKIGLKTNLLLDKPGVLGKADLEFGFKPPSGIGLAIDATIVKGGGFLKTENGNYYGIVELSVQNRIAITAIGILITRTDYGDKTFSFKILGFAEFPSIQIGFGFSISGLGIAVAISCRMSEEKLREAVYGGSLRALLFPPDPVANAPQIIRDLNDFFPVDEGTYIIGAMVKLAWGAGKPLIKADVGIFCEFGRVVRIALAGMAYATLPDEQAPVLILNLQVLGIIDFGKKTLSIDSSLTGSKLLDWDLDGDIALRSAWGDNPRFALSAGGFYPGYQAPAGFPSMRRISITIGSGNPRIGLLCYFALTENSVQVGATLLFYWSDEYWIVGLIEIEGAIGFDALFQFNPFYFETRFFACFSLKRDGDTYCSIDLKLSLSGPNNYHAVGSATLEICGIDVSVDFDKRFGPIKPEEQQVSSPKQLLMAELLNVKNWYVREENEQSRGTILLVKSNAETLAEPLGVICFSQRAIPLKMQLDKVGKTIPDESERWFMVKALDCETVPITEFFAPNEFLNLSEEEQISSQPFEKLEGGLEMKMSRNLEYNPNTVKSRQMQYETMVVQSYDNLKPFEPNLFTWDGNSKTSKYFDCNTTDDLKLSISRIGKKYYTNKPSLMKKLKTNWLCRVESQKVTVITNCFDVAKTPDGAKYPSGSYSQIQQKFKSSGRANSDTYIIDAIRAKVE